VLILLISLKKGVCLPSLFGFVALKLKIGYILPSVTEFHGGWGSEKFAYDDIIPFLMVFDIFLNSHISAV
jgi:hypothetical protein